MLDKIQQKRQHRPNKNNDGSLSDSNYATYGDLPQPGRAASPFSWLQPASTYAAASSNTGGAPQSLPYQPQAGNVEAYNLWVVQQMSGEANLGPNSSDILGSNESLNSVSSSIQQARANSLTKAHLLMHQQQHQNQELQNRNPNLVIKSRGSDISSTSCTTGNYSDTDYYGIIPYRKKNDESSTHMMSKFTSQPTSPIKDQQRIPGMLVPTNTSLSQLSSPARHTSLPPSYGSFLGAHTKSPIRSTNLATCPEQATGSNLSLHLSTSPQPVMTKESDAMVDLLRKELIEEHERVMSLTSQLTTNAQVVAAFEQSLTNMTSRLHDITATAERKDSEIIELRQTIERLRQSGADAGMILGNKKMSSNDVLERQQSTDSVVSACSSIDEEQGTKSKNDTKDNGQKRSGWLRHSFSKAFSKGDKETKQKSKNANKNNASISDVEDNATSQIVETNKKSNKVISSNGKETLSSIQRSNSIASGKYQPEDETIRVPQSPKDHSKKKHSEMKAADEAEIIGRLRRQLMEKDCQLTETRLEALSSAHQLDSMRETVTKMRNELVSLKCDNERLQNTVLHTNNTEGVGNRESINSSHSSLNINSNNGAGGIIEENGGSSGNDGSEDRRLSSATSLSDTSLRSASHAALAAAAHGPSTLDLSATTDPTNKDGGKLVSVSVVNTTPLDCVKIGTIAVSGKSNWDLLDSLIHRLFQEYVMRIDPSSSLGLSATESIHSYKVGEICRRNPTQHPNQQNPELLPYGYLIGDTLDIKLVLHGSSHVVYGIQNAVDDSTQIDALAFQTVTPKPILQRYVSLLLENKRIMLCGASGIGKTYLATKLANFLIQKDTSKNANLKSPLVHNKPSSSAIATFSVGPNNVSELRHFLQRVWNNSSSIHCSNSETYMPKVIILDNLHHAGRLENVFEGFKMPSSDPSNIKNNTECEVQYIIGTMNNNSLNSATSPTATANGLQMSHNFRWLVCSAYTEPARGVLGRCLRQRLVFIETRTRSHDGEMALVIEFLVRVHAYLNRLISEFNNNESNVSAVPPSLFLSCPINAGSENNTNNNPETSQKWFVQLWNETLCPLLIDIISEGVSLYPKQGSEWQDPSRFVIEHWPWNNHNQNNPLQHPRNQLVSIKPEDVGLKLENDEKSSYYSSTSNLSSASRPTSVSNGSEDSNSTTATNESAVSSAPTDPLFNMLLTLQEAANKEG